jgi:hypothetical protein
LGQTTYIPDDQLANAPIYSDATGGFTPFAPSAAASLYESPSSAAYGTPAIPGSISPQDAALLSTAITTAGKVGTQAIIGTPTETYNPLTGQYTATGGAVLPASIGLDSTISSYLPLILLGGGLILIISMAGKR